MPFLLMALIGVDRFFEKNKKVLLTISVFLIIMTSYYYSVGSIICIIMYGIYKYFETKEDRNIKDFLITGLKFLFPIIVGILMSSILIFPSLYSILNGRGDITNAVNVKKLFIPMLNYKELVYGSYTIGTTSILFFAITNAITSKNKSNNIISLILIFLITFPIIMYVLSGFMYVRGKVLIPLLPIVILLITSTFEDLNIRKNPRFIILLSIIFITQIIFYIFSKNYLYLIDTILVFISYFIYRIKGNKDIIIYITILMALINCLVVNYKDKLVTKEDISLQYNTYNYNKLNNLMDNDKNIYRFGNDILGMDSINRVENIDYYLPSIYSSIENKDYEHFVNNVIGNEMPYRISSAITSSKNIVFNTIMGVKYLLTTGAVPIGYTNIKDSNIYVNNNVFTIGHSTTNIMSKDEYDDLSYQDKIYALSKYIIVDKDVTSKFKSQVNEEKITYDVEEKTIDSIETNNTYEINSKDNGKLTLKLRKPFENKIIFISFNMNYSENCKIGDTTVTINGVSNTLSCKTWMYPNNNNKFTYLLSSNDKIDKLNIEFTKGKYEISDINVYSLDYKYILNNVKSIDKFNIDKDKTKGDNIVGNINVTENGYFMLSIPYDRNFGIYVDGKKVNYEKVNEAFIGFEIYEGSHEIKITYISPYLLEGLVASLAGYMIFLPILYSDFRKRGKR